MSISAILGTKSSRELIADSTKSRRFGYLPEAMSDEPKDYEEKNDKKKTAL